MSRFEQLKKLCQNTITPDHVVMAVLSTYLQMYVRYWKEISEETKRMGQYVPPEDIWLTCRRD